MTRINDFSFRNSCAAQRQRAEPPSALLRMQADSPAGERVDERLGVGPHELRLGR